MSRWISFFVLVAVIVVISAFFLRVMAEFLVPLFVACILVVLFRPVHLWILSKMPKRPATAAVLTSSTMLLSVVIPTGFLLIFAAAEGNEMVRRFDMAMISRKVQELRKSFDLEIPHSISLTELETDLGKYRTELSNITKTSSNSQSGLIQQGQIHLLRNNNAELIKGAKSLGTKFDLKWPPATPVKEAKKENASPNPDAADENEKVDEKAIRPTGDGAIEAAWFRFAYDLMDTQSILAQEDWKKPEVDGEYLELENRLNDIAADSLTKFREFKINLLGGSLLTFVKEVVNPKQEEVDRYTKSAFEFLTSSLLSWGGTATVFLGRLVFGGMIVVIAFYFFLVDGPGMMQTLMQLSPMDDRHEQELVDEFERVSRAVVLATLAAAVAQGLLAGIGFYFAGVPSVFLLTLLTMLLAMIPFVGAAAVWVPVCLYLLVLKIKSSPPLL